MYEIQIIYDNLAKANIINLKAALLSIKHIKNITVNKDTSIITLLSKKKNIREDLLINAGKMAGSAFRTIVKRKKI